MLLDSLHHPPKKPDIYVSALSVYPLKGAAGFSPRQWPTDERGLRHDRRFMLVNDDGVFISQRQYKRLALVQTMVEGETLHISCPRTAEDSARVHHDAKVNAIDISIALDKPDGEAMPVIIWDDTVDAIHVSGKADAILSGFLQTSCRLVWMPPTAHRITAAKRGEPRRAVSFADAAPLLLTSEAALDELNERLKQGNITPVPMDRFRPNIVVRGCTPQEDDHWTELLINDIRLRVTNACPRCGVITIDQKTAQQHSAEPMRTLCTYRQVGTTATFGQHLLVDSEGIITIGDRVRVLATGR